MVSNFFLYSYGIKFVLEKERLIIDKMVM